MKTTPFAAALLAVGLLVPASTYAQDKGLPAGALLRLGSEKFRHADARSAVYSPDGKFLVTAAKEIRIWDAGTGQLVRTIQPDRAKDQALWKLRFSGDGKTLCASTLAGEAVGSVVGFDFATGKQRFRIADSLHFVHDISHDGKVLAMGMNNNTVTLWSTATQKKLRTIDGDHTRFKAAQAAGKTSSAADSINLVSLSPDGNLVAACALYDDTVRVYDLETGKQRHAFPANHPFRVHALFSPDSKYLATSRRVNPEDYRGTEVITIWDLATGKEHKQFTEPSIAGFTASPDWKWMAAHGLKDGKFELQIWDRATGTRRPGPLTAGPFGLSSLAFARDGATLLTTGSSVDLWDVKTGRAILTDGHTGAVRSIDISPDGKTIASGGADGTAYLWDATTGKIRQRFAHGIPISSVAFAPDGATLALSSDAGSVGLIVHDVATGKELHRMGPVGWNYPARAGYSPDGKSLVTGSAFDLVCRFFDTTTWELKRSFPEPSASVDPAHPHRLGPWHFPFRFASDGKHFAGMHHHPGSNDVVVAMWDLGVKEPRIISKPAKDIVDLAFSPDGEYLAWSDPKGTHIWEVRENVLLKTLPGATGCVAFTSDGRHVAVGKKLHPLSAKHPHLELPIEPGLLAFSRDGRIAVAALRDECTLLVIDAKKLASKK